MRFESKVDGWIAAIALLTPVVVLGAIGTQWYLTHHDLRGPLAGVAVLIAMEIVFIGWVFRSTYYVIENGTLVIRSSFITWRVPIREITSVTPTRSALSSPALSLDRLRIEYGRKAIMVSPADKQGFIDALRTVNPAIIRRE